MFQLDNRQVVGVVLMSLLLVLAGCNGLGGGTTETQANTTTTDGMAGTEDGSSNGTDSRQIEVSPYQFTEGESYTYNVTFLGSNSQMTWDVVSVDGEDVTVEITSESARGTQNTTINGTQETILQSAAEDQSGAIFASSRAPLAILSMGAGTEGNFTIESDNIPGGTSFDWDTATVSPQGTRTVNGVGCSEFVVDPDDRDQDLTACVAEDYPFALSVDGEQDGQTALAIDLTNATRP